VCVRACVRGKEGGCQSCVPNLHISDSRQTTVWVRAEMIFVVRTHEYSPIARPLIMMCCSHDFNAGTQKYKPAWSSNKLRPAQTAKIAILDWSIETGIPRHGICKGCWYRHPLVAPLMPSREWLTISPLFVLPTPARKRKSKHAKDKMQIMIGNIMLNANMHSGSTFGWTTSHPVADAVAVAVVRRTAAAKPRTSTKAIPP
jgi:hypothetical protein